jgi:glycerate-2-kinase
MRKYATPVCLISGGEVAVRVTSDGTGGRNQQFALYCAQQIENQNITVLSIGTDGVDGNSVAAGAVVDGLTMPDRGRVALSRGFPWQHSMHPRSSMRQVRQS